MAGDAPKETVPPRGLALYTKILIGLVAGALAAIVVKSCFVGEGALISNAFELAQLVEFGERWIQPIGDFFIRAIILTVVPLVFTSIAIGIHGLGDLRALGRLGGRTLVIFLGTAFVGACIATVLATQLAPGAAISDETRVLLTEQFQQSASGANVEQMANRFEGSFLQIILSLVPENITMAMTSNRDLLKVILFALVFGIALTLIDSKRAEPVAKVLDGVNEAMIKLIGLMMHLAPYGVFALVFMVVIRFGTDVLLALAVYTAVVLLALAAHVGLVLLPLVRVLGGWAPIAFLKAIREVWVTAFSTSSSSATLPTTMRVAEENLRVPRPIVSFVLPLGATVNMDGTTIYQVVAVHFVAQVFGVPMDASTMFTLIVVSMLMAIGAAGVPGGVIPLLYVVLATVGVPENIIPQGIALILGMDRILDMCRSAVNVVGDTATAVIVARGEPGADNSAPAERAVDYPSD